MLVSLHDGSMVVKVLDFGLARVRLAAEEEQGESEPSGSVTRDAILVGTPKYMAPEQGVDPHDVDGQSDVYSLGAVAFEVLSGAPPFAAATAWELLTHHLRSAPPSLSTLVPAAPADQLLRTVSDKLYVVPGNAGVATKMHMVQRLLIGSHTATAAEAIGLAAKAGLNAQQVYDIIANAAGIFAATGHRVLHSTRASVIWIPSWRPPEQSTSHYP